ncbi:MAG TPA: hypothetical protein VF800_02650 [Telluria sp.]|jgi:hypothetical protein
MSRPKPKRTKAYHPKPCVKPLGMRQALMMEMPGYVASLALGLPHFCERHVYDLLSNADLTRRIAPDGHPILPIAKAMVLAIAEIQHRAQETEKTECTAGELAVLREGVGRTMDYLRTVPNVEISRASAAALAEFDRLGCLRV